MLAVALVDLLDPRELHDVGADAEDHPPAPSAPRRGRRASIISAFISRTAAAMPVDDCARDDGVPDVELDDLLDRGDRLHVVVVQAVPGVHREAERRAEPRRIGDPGELAPPARSPVASA